MTKKDIGPTYSEEPAFVGQFLLGKHTKNTIMYIHNSDKINLSGFPYPYIKKRLWEQMGCPSVVEITVAAVWPQVKES